MISLLQTVSNRLKKTPSNCRVINRPVTARQQKKLGLTPIVAVAIAASTLTGLVNRTDAYSLKHSNRHSTLAQVTQPEVDPAEVDPAEVDPALPEELAEPDPLVNGPSPILLIEIVVAVLLLVSLIAAFLANRAARQAQSTVEEKKPETPSGTDTTWDSLEEFSSEQARVLEQLNAAIGEQNSDQSASMLAAAQETKLVTATEEKRDDSLIELPAQEESPSDQISLLEQQEEAEQEQILTVISLRLREAICLEDLFKTAVKEVRRALRTERVIVFGFDPTNWDGTVVAESVAPGLPQTLRVKIDDPCFRDRHVEMYKQGRVRAINNIYQEPGLTDCYLRMLEQFAVKANMVAPILKHDQLLGLLIAHHCSEARIWQKTEVNLFAQLATQVGLAIDQVSFLEQQEEEAEQAQLLTEIGLRIRQSFSMEELLKTTVKEVRRALRIDRVIILGFDPIDWEGVVVAESVAPGLPQTLRVKIDDPCFRDGFIDLYQQGRVRAINNIYQDPDLTDCYIRTLEQFAVKACMIAPILKNKQLLGLLIAHHCSEPRTWQKSEINLFAQLATQVGFTVDRVNLLEQSE